MTNLWLPVDSCCSQTKPAAAIHARCLPLSKNSPDSRKTRASGRAKKKKEREKSCLSTTSMQQLRPEYGRTSQWHISNCVGPVHAQQRGHARSLFLRKTRTLVASNEPVLLDVGDTPAPADMQVHLPSGASWRNATTCLHALTKCNYLPATAVVLWVKQKATGSIMTPLSLHRVDLGWAKKRNKTVVMWSSRSEKADVENDNEIKKNSIVKQCQALILVSRFSPLSLFCLKFQSSVLELLKERLVIKLCVLQRNILVGLVLIISNVYVLSRKKHPMF